MTEQRPETGDPHARRVAVITGGANGIGEGIADAFAARGYDLALLDIRESDLRTTVDRLRDAGTNAVGHAVDVRDAAALDGVAQEVARDLGPVTALCANAGGGGRERPVWQIPLEEWRTIFDINVFGAIATVQAFLPSMIAEDQGHVVVTASMQGITTGRVGPYASSKHAVASFTETLAADLRRSGSAVRVSCLCPSFTQNSMLKNPQPSSHVLGAQHEPLTEEEVEARKRVIQRLADFGKPAREVGELVAGAIGGDRFWLIPEPASTGRVLRRWREIARDAGVYAAEAELGKGTTFDV